MKILLESLLQKIFPNKAKQAERYGLDNLDDDVIGYPPDQKGIPVVKNSVLIERLNADIRFLRNELGLTAEDFELYLTPVITDFIKYAHLLPASEYHHHSTGGGLIYHSLDVAKRAMRKAQISQYPVSIGTMADTQQSNQQWKTATVLAALLHDCGKIVTDMVVSNGQQGKARLEWDSYGNQNITEWAFEHNIERYFISWSPTNRNKAHLNASVAVLQRLIPQHTMSWIDSCYDGKTIHTAMLASVASANAAHVLSKIVAESDSASVKQDMYNRNSHITKEMKRTPISLVLSDLIKHYIIIGRWEINKKNAKVWFIDDELYFVWNKIVPELVGELEKAGYTITDSADVLARVMIEEGVAECCSDDELYFPIFPEILGDKKKPQRLICLKYIRVEKVIKNPEKLYSISQHKAKTKSSKETTRTQEPIDNNMAEEIEEISSTPEIEQPVYIENARVSVQRLIKSAATVTQHKTIETEHKVIETKVAHDEPAPPITIKFESEFIKYAYEKFDLQFEDGAIILPLKLLNDVAMSISENFGDITEFEAMNDLKTNKEVTLI
ncbi:MobH family relaxase [Psychromonas aquimarina]|uniref:MobH family relaxase n=1 Tax=Psychromonas aquimarina TaxID=444919 RepID=UPI000428D20D|nr:MobH family relaxase [Psychromonas aquimarina]